MAIVVVVSMVGSTFVLFAPEASARTGSDSFGYTFKDSSEAGLDATWTELIGTAGTTTLLSSSTDGGQGPYDLPFAFELYEKEYTKWGNGGDNGYITLGAAVSNQWTSYHIPASQLGDAAVAGAWFDGGFCRSSNPTAGVYYNTIGTTPNRQFIVQYQDQGAWYPSVYQCPGAAAADALTWQIILHEGSNKISVNYQDTNGGYGSDNEQATTGIQGKPEGNSVGLEYIYRNSPVAFNTLDDNGGSTVEFLPPPPARNDIRLKATNIPDPVSLADNNQMGATISNNGVNCDTAGDCEPIAETDISVSAKVFSIKEETTDYTFDDRTNTEGFTHESIQGVDGWTQALNDGNGNYNEGDEGADDGAWSSGRKSESLGGMFDDNQKIHYDGTDILISNPGDDSLKKLSPATNTVTEIIPYWHNYLHMNIDVTEDGTNYYTLARTSGTYNAMTKVCKWLMSDVSAAPLCNTTNVKYGTALTYYDGEVFVLQTYSSASYRKVIVLDATDMTKSTDFSYGSGISAYSYAQDIDVNEDGDGSLWIAYRDFSGTVREYHRDGSGGYSQSSYSQTYMYSRYHSSITVSDDYVYTTGYYYSSYYGGIKRLSTSGGSVNTLFSSYSVNGYRSSMAVTSSGDIYVATNYAYSYYNFANWDDKIFVHEGTTGGSDYSSTPSATLGPNPASLSALKTPIYDTSDAVGMTMSFKISYQFYYLYEGALMESSTDGGATWDYIPSTAFSQGEYYGTGSNYYGNPMDISKQQWTYYNTNAAYTYNTQVAPWKTMGLDLTSFAGYDAVQFRWVVGFNQYDNTYYYNSYFRLDDVSVTMKVADVTYAEETKIVTSLGFKETATVSFFENDAFKPMDLGMKVGDKVGILVNVPDNGGDQDMSNNRDVQFRDVKYVIFSDNFEDGDGSDWSYGKIRYGSGESWSVADDSAYGGSYSMDSGHRMDESPLPADNWAASPSMDLSLPVEASLQMYIAYYAYYTYDGFQVQASPDGGTTWNLLTPDADNEKQYYVIYNYAYYNNPLRGQKGYAYYGSSTGFTYSPDPQGFKKATFDLTEYCGNPDVKIRFVTGWGTLPTAYPYYDSFMRVDDVAVTGLVYNNNVGLNGFDLPDPLGVDSTVAIETEVINAGLINQDSGATKVRLQLGPIGVETYAMSEDFESYASESEAITAGWTSSDDCNITSCPNWGTYGEAGFVLNDDEGDGDESTSWGPDGGEFQMYYGGGSTEVVTPGLDFSGTESDLSLTLKHRYNFDYYAGYTSYNGGQVQISLDGGTTYSMIEPVGGYPGTMYNYAGYGNPLYGQKGFVHCGDCSGVSGGAGDDKDKYVSSTFDMAAYSGMDDVRIKFITGMYSYQWPGDGEHWHIDSLSFTGTGMASVAKSQTWDITGDGTLGEFMSGASQTVGLDYYFQVPGQYKIVFDTWIGDNPSSGIDEFAGDNSLGLARETMFTVGGTTADDTTNQKKVDDNGRIMYNSGWSAQKDGGPAEGFMFRPSATTGATTAPVWWSGIDAYGQAYNGDDVSLVSPVFDLSKATSAKLVFDHKYFFQGYEYTWANYYYDGGRVEISADEGATWTGLSVTGGEPYGGVVYNYAYYGNPLAGKEAFVMDSGGAFVSSECRLDSFTGAGFDTLQIRFRLGGAFYNYQTSWEIDGVGIYGLGFDLDMTSDSTPYTLEVGEEATFSTSFKNQGAGDLGPSGTVTSAFATAYVNKVDGTEVWSASQTLGSLNMAYYDSLGNTYAGESTPQINFTYPGMDTAGVYTAGVKITNADGTDLSDLFSSNHDASHMLIVGKSADMGAPLLTGGENWAATANEPSSVGDGAMGVAWDQTGIATDTLDVNIGAAGVGYTPADPVIQLGTTVTWTNTDSSTHTVTDKNSQFDSFDIAPSESFSMTFNEVGIFSYYCKFHPMMEGSITVVSSQNADEMVRTNYVQVWSKESFLVFWANFDMSDDSSISVYAQKKGSSIDDSDSLGLWSANGFTIMDGMDHSEVGDSLTYSSDWNPYYISLNSKKLGYNSLEYDPSDDNSYSFVFRARGVEGTADIGGVQVIRTLDTGFYLTKDDVSKLTYDIFPSLAVEMDYFVKNIGTVSSSFGMTPEVNAQGKSYGGPAFDIDIEVMMNGVVFDSIIKTQNEDGTWTHEFDMDPDDEAMVTIRFVAPDYNSESGEPAGNRKFDVVINGQYGDDESLREPIAATLFIKPSQFVLGEMTFNRASVIEGDNIEITVKAWNEGNYASDVLVVFYVMDPTGDAYSTPTGTQRMTRVASTTIDVMAPKPVLENDGVYQTWYYATATWDETFIPGTTVQDFETVDMYAEINPLAEEMDKSAGIKSQDEYLNQKEDNDAVGTLNIVKNKASTPSFAVGIIGLAVAAMVAAIGASLRREEE